MKKTYSLAVAEFALPSPMMGSIDSYSGFGQGQTLGQQLHVEIQLERERNYSSYKPEVWIMQTLKLDKYSFNISGRIDGIFQDAKPKIEEIKTAFDIKKLERFLENTHDTHPYWLQLKTYGYFYWLKYKEIPDLSLLIVSQRNRKSIELTTTLDIDAYEAYMQRRLKDLVKEIKLSNKRIKRRVKASADLTFPFANPRVGQAELIATVKKGMENNQQYLVQAPTGLGKTMGILYPTLQESLSRGLKVVYVTPKNSQHRVAEDAVKRLQEQGANIQSLTVKAKSKLCMKAHQLCTSQYCEFAENHYTKVAEHDLFKLARKQRNANGEFFKELAATYQVCPYELQMDSVPYFDTIICDYNYAFAPHVAATRVSKIQIGEHNTPNLVIDEIHNLPARSLDYYSPILSVLFFERMCLDMTNVAEPFREKMYELLQECVSLIKSCKEKNRTGSHKITPANKLFTDQDDKLSEFLVTYLESDVEISNNDMVIALCQYWKDFTLALDFVHDAQDEFFVSYLSNPEAIKITCCDASKMLATCYDNYKQIVGFSATLKPFNYYSQLCGLNTKKLKTAEFLSPFPPERRKIITIPQISTKYSDRTRNYPRIAEAIKKITAIKPGNYLIFFPSFDFMEKVLQCYEPCHRFKILQQSRQMKEMQITALLDQLQDTQFNHLVFAVQGGVFSEGLDYVGHLAIGVFVVGPPLPVYDWEREQIKLYYENRYAAGVDYAYTYPAMAKAIQAAGRVIRSETDKGIIVLIDNRFLLDNYAQCMPRDWFVNHPQETVSQSILKDITDFWNN